MLIRLLIFAASLLLSWPSNADKTPGGVIYTIHKTGSLRMRVLSATVTPAPEDLGKAGSIWVCAFIPVSTVWTCQDKSGGWVDAVVPAKSDVVLAPAMVVNVLDMTSSGVREKHTQVGGDYLLRLPILQGSTIYVLASASGDQIEGKYFIADTIARTTGVDVVGTDEWEVNQERLAEKRVLPVVPGQSVTQGYVNPSCPQFQAYGYPEVSDPKISERVFYECRDGFASMFDPVEEAPLWVAEHLKQGQLTGTASRTGLDFKIDPLVPYLDQGHVQDYSHSGFDLGHLAPARDYEASDVLMEQSFVMTNAVPQYPNQNRGVWATLESSVRAMAESRGELYVMTGPVFKDPRVKILGGSISANGSGVSVPSSLYKVLLDPIKREMTAFMIPNTATQAANHSQYQVTVRDVELATGLNFNPTLPAAEADYLETNGNW